MEVIIFPKDCSGCPLVDLVLVSGSSSFLFLNLINILFFLGNGFFFSMGLSTGSGYCNKICCSYSCS